MLHSFPWLGQLSSLLWILFALILMGRVGRRLIVALTKIYI